MTTRASFLLKRYAEQMHKSDEFDDIGKDLSHQPGNARLVAETIREFIDEILAGKFRKGRDLNDAVYKKFGNDWMVTLWYALGKDKEDAKFMKEHNKRVPDTEETLKILDKIYGILISEVKKRFR